MDSNPAYRLAYEVFLDRLLNFVGAYVFKLLGNGPGSHIDGLVFSGGIGEKSVELRRDVAGYLQWVGCRLDDERNQAGVTEVHKNGIAEVTNDDSKFKLYVCQTVRAPRPRGAWQLIETFGAGRGGSDCHHGVGSNE